MKRIESTLEHHARKAGQHPADYLIAQLNKHGAVSRTAVSLGLHSETIHQYMRKYGIKSQTIYTVREESK